MVLITFQQLFEKILLRSCLISMKKSDLFTRKKRETIHTHVRMDSLTSRKLREMLSFQYIDLFQTHNVADQFFCHGIGSNFCFCPLYSNAFLVLLPADLTMNKKNITKRFALTITSHELPQ